MDEARTSLLVSAYWKIPLQALVLLVGVLTFTFYLFTPPPMLFNAAHDAQIRASERSGEYAALAAALRSRDRRPPPDRGQLWQRRRVRARRVRKPSSMERFRSADDEVKKIRAEAVGIVKAVSGDTSYNDVNYVFPAFVTSQLPIGLVGLLVSAILVAAMSASSAELSALSTSTIIDIYQRQIAPDASDQHLLFATRLATGFWGLFASLVAIRAAELGSLIEVVNRFGSLFYGSILGVFVLAVGFKRANGNGAFIGVLVGMATIVYVATYTKIAFLWHNLIGTVVVLIVGLTISALLPEEEGLVARFIIGPILLVILLMVVSWTVGEYLRQRRR